MTLAAFSILVGASPKWVLNTLTLLRQALTYSAESAERLALVHVLNRDFGIMVPVAWRLSAELVAVTSRGSTRVATADATVALHVDLDRLRSAVATRRAQVNTMHAPRRAGRPPRKPRSALQAAEQHGLDLTLLRANLARSTTERLRQLDGMAAFRGRVHRKEER